MSALAPASGLASSVERQLRPSPRRLARRRASQDQRHRALPRHRLQRLARSRAAGASAPTSGLVALSPGQRACGSGACFGGARASTTWCANAPVAGAAARRLLLVLRSLRTPAALAAVQRRGRALPYKPGIVCNSPSQASEHSMSDVQQRIDDLVKNNRVVLFMKGTAQFPMCGFSGRAMQILKACGVRPDDRQRARGRRDPPGHQGVRQLADDPAALRQRRVRRRLGHHDGDVPVRRAAAGAGARPDQAARA